jgi:hypothetical protein
MKILYSILFALICFSGFSQNKITVTVAGGTSSSGGLLTSQDTSIISLKTLGFLSDADLSFGSSTFGTDQTTAIQAVLNRASATYSLRVVWDIRASTTGLKIKSNTIITALPNCGAILRDSSNDFIFYNYNWVGQSNAFVDSNITITGGIWNGNGFRGGTGKQLHSNSTKGMMTAFNFSGVKNLSLINNSIINTRTYGLLTMTTDNMIIDGMNIDQGGSPIINQDGMSIIGYAKNIRILNSRFRCGDDRISFGANAFGGSIGTEHHEPYTGVNGDQEQIRIDNIYFYGVGQGIGLYCAGGNTMSNFFISNISGTSFSYWCSMFNADVGSGYTITTGSNVLKNIIFENINVEVSSYRPSGPTNYPLVVLACSAEDITFRNIKRTDYTLINQTFGVYKAWGSTAVTIQNLTIDSYSSINTSPASASTHLYVNGATVSRLNFINANIDLGSTTRNAALINIQTGGVVNSMSVSGRLNALKYVVNNAGTITNLNAYAISHTGQGGSDPTILTSGTLTKAVMSNWLGVLATSGTIGTLTGDWQ